jgi:nucleotide-binding universal stress UspA family protein
MGADLLEARRTMCASTAVRRRPGLSPLAVAVQDELDRHPAGTAGTTSVSMADAAPRGCGIPVLVHPERGREPSGPVLVALDDDANAAALTAYGLTAAAHRGVSLRTVYVWTDCRPPDCDHHRACHHDLADAAQLLADIIEQHLSIEELDEVERDVVHHTDPGRALVDLSDSASLLVVGASSRHNPRGLLGETTRELLVHTCCPLAVVPTAPPRFPVGLRRPAPTSRTFAPDQRGWPGPRLRARSLDVR